ncbi:transferrin 2 [Parasteatoda tepidariorum]|uniref:transferrin 2 n=1 Tax=Parasteatoda tepidariorum TaxID=114398 RepID=UPI00077F990D|nr:melanotransferrin [Parasteatoda tepidariorum]
MEMSSWAWFTVFVFYCTISVGEAFYTNAITWCTISDAEQRKCIDFSKAVNRTRSVNATLSCYQAADRDQCMNVIESGRANLMTLDPGEIYVAGRFNSLVPVVSERYTNDEDGYYAVAVARESLTVRSLEDLRGTKACFPGVGQMAGWVIPISVLIDLDFAHVVDCNNLIKTAAAFFGPSCAPNSLIDKYNPTGDNPMDMCDLCVGDKTTKCSGSDPYADFDGAFNCLISGSDIAFLKHTTMDEMTSSEDYRGPRKNLFKLVCPNGATANIDSYKTCNWGFVPAHAVVTSSAASPEQKRFYQKFLSMAASKFRNPRYSSGSFRRDPYDDVSNDPEGFQLFGTYDKYNERNLLFQDLTVDLVPLEERQQTFTGYLGNMEKNFHQKLQKCPIPPARLCVVSDQEMKKCQKMKTAFKAKMLRPDLVCVKGFSQMKCMQMINENAADLVVLDAGEIYKAGQKYNLMPIIAEQYDLEEPAYYVIAVAKTPDKDTDLLYLKGKKSCHTGIGMAAGWVVPMSFLLSSERMRSYGCDSAHAAAEFFQKSCVPGALSREYTVGDVDYTTLCDLCHGVSSYYCSKSSQEPFYGHTGALRCLVEGGGDIAFVKHTTILENTAGKNPDWWSRPMMPDDFELLCRDGTRAAFDMHESCNLGKVASNAIVTDRMKPAQYINAYIDLFLYAQQYYGSKYSEEFTLKMFVSEDDYSDLIFQDATQQLKRVPDEKRDYKLYLGREFLLEMTIVDCTAAAGNVMSSIFIILVSFIFHLWWSFV